MKIITYHREQELPDYLENFRNLYHGGSMKYLASDLLNEGISLPDIAVALKRAMMTIKVCGLEMDEHFIPVYTQIQHDIVKDCKLSRFGYALVILNTRTDNLIAAELQVEVLKKFLK